MKLSAIVSLLNGFALTAVSTAALADIPPPLGYGCSTAASTSPATLTGTMLLVGVTAFVVSRRRRGSAA